MRGKEMLRGTVISSGSMPFSTNVIFKAEKMMCPYTILKKKWTLTSAGTEVRHLRSAK